MFVLVHTCDRRPSASGGLVIAVGGRLESRVLVILELWAGALALFFAEAPAGSVASATVLPSSNVEACSNLQPLLAERPVLPDGDDETSRIEAAMLFIADADAVPELGLRGTIVEEHGAERTEGDAELFVFAGTGGKKPRLGSSKNARDRRSRKAKRSRSGPGRRTDRTQSMRRARRDRWSCAR